MPSGSRIRAGYREDHENGYLGPSANGRTIGIGVEGLGDGSR